MTKIETARQAAAGAHAELQRALLAGEDTTAARRAMTDAEARLSALERVEVAGPDPSVEAEIQTEAAALVEQTVAAITERVAALSPYPRPETIDLPAASALAVVRARRRRAEHEGRVADHTAREQRIQTRLDDLAARREALVTRRMAGDERPEDAAELSLIEADRRALEQMRSEHRSSRPAEPVELRHAEENWRRTCIEAEGRAMQRLGDALQQHAIVIAERLVDFNRLAGVAPGGIGYRLRVDARWRSPSAAGVW